MTYCRKRKCVCQSQLTDCDKQTNLLRSRINYDCKMLLGFQPQDPIYKSKRRKMLILHLNLGIRPRPRQLAKSHPSEGEQVLKHRRIQNL
jgi:hypothetical protein